MSEYRASALAMPGNPASKSVGGQMGLFRVMVESREPGGDWTFVEYREEDLPYKEAFAAAGRIHQELNKPTE
jgi:hypothetical protein